MKRTAEITLGIIGAVCSVIMLIFGISILSLNGNAEFQQGLEDVAAEDPYSNPGDADLMAAMISSGGWAFTIAALIGLIIGLIAVFSIKGNKKPKLAGILYIAGAVLTGLISIGFGFVPAILYLIAGIMSLVRKPKAYTDITG